MQHIPVELGHILLQLADHKIAPVLGPVRFWVLSALIGSPLVAGEDGPKRYQYINLSDIRRRLILPRRKKFPVFCTWVLLLDFIQALQKWLGDGIQKAKASTHGVSQLQRSVHTKDLTARSLSNLVQREHLLQWLPRGKSNCPESS